ncbi:MAG TPA: glycosyltransferase, partial [Polyangiaceae bacterium]
GIKSWIARSMLHALRIWDYRTSAGVNHFVANSNYISRRIRKVYGRESHVIYPPVDIHEFTLVEQKDDYYLAASRLVPYKKMDLIAEAFRQMPEKRLVIVGDGPDMEKVRSHAGPNVELLGYRPREELIDLMQRARAFVFAAEEDFGIAPVEAQACGTPVIAFGKGGARETVRPIETSKPTGLFFDQQVPSSLIDAVRIFEAEEGRFSPLACRENARRFDASRFRAEFADFVEGRFLEFTHRNQMMPITA